MAKTKTSSKTPTDYSRWYLAAIVAFTFLLYAGSLKNELLTFDDNDYFAYEEVRELSWEGVQNIFTSHHLIMYQPLPVLSFALQHHFTGLEPQPYHLVNLLLHLWCVVLVFMLIQELVGNRWISLGVSLLFAIHPMHVEAVAWMSARSSSMYAAFYLLALLTYLRFLKNGNTRNLWLTGLFFILSLFSKVQAVTLPLVMLLLDVHHGRKLSDVKNMATKIPFFAMSLVFGLIALSDESTQQNITDGMLEQYPIWQLPFLVSWSFLFYITKLFVPIDLCAIYTYPPLNDGQLGWIYYASMIPFLFLGWVLWRYRQNRMVVLGAGFFILTIAINIQIIPSRLFIVADRYTYIPYIGLYLLMLHLISQWSAKPKHRSLSYGLLSVYLLALPVVSHARIKMWKEDIPFLTDIIEKNQGAPYIYRAYGNRAVKYQSMSRTEEALADYTKALELYGEDGKTYFNRSKVYMMMGRNAEALADLDSAAFRDSSQAALYSLRGQVHLMMSDTASCIRDSERALQMDSLDYDAWNTLSTVAYARANYDDCMRYINKAIAAKPEFAIALKNRGLLHLKLGLNKEACNDFQAAAYLNNQDAAAFYQQYCK